MSLQSKVYSQQPGGREKSEKEEAAIKVNGVYKDFKLPHEKVSSLKGLFTGAIKRKKQSKLTTYETQRALQDISFEVNKGEFFGIVGRNGSGKSTLLKILAGIYQPTKGTVHTSGKLVPFIELGVGFNPELTGRENVFLNGAILGFSEDEVSQMYDEIVSFAELERFMDQKLKNYSSGMQVRLAFSMAIRAQAEILLVDEVLAVGDADFQRKCFDYFRTLKKEGATVVFVTHDMDAVREYCDKALLIEKNEVAKIGAPSDIATLYTKMFTAEQPLTAELQDTIKRWGNKYATINKVNIHTPKIDEDTSIRILLEIAFKKSVRTPIAGFVIKNSSGISLLGTNTKLMQRPLKSMLKGERCTIEWSIPNIFTDGKYTIDVAILESDGITVNDWWEEARRFTIYKTVSSPYPMAPPMTLEVKNEGI